MRAPGDECHVCLPGVGVRTIVSTGPQGQQCSREPVGCEISLGPVVFRPHPPQPLKALSPVVWSEGMHLAQHHFQAQSRYVVSSTAFAMAAVRPHPYGLIHCELDEEALVNGSVALVGARGVMPDGMPFDFSLETLPDPLSIRDRFSPTRGGQVVALTLPTFRTSGANCALDSDSPGDFRYGVVARSYVDETSGQDEKRIELARKNFRLALDPEPSDDLAVLPLARVVRAGSGSFSYDPAFVPPCLHIGGSSRLKALLRRFIEILDQRARSLREVRGRPADGLSEYASREILGFWLSHSVRSSLAVVRHLYESSGSSPEDVYLELSRLAGALCTFSMELNPEAIPLYDHDDLGKTFSDLESFIRRGLEVVLPKGAGRIALIPVLKQQHAANLQPEERGVAQFVHSGAVTDSRAFGRQAVWFLGVRSNLPAAEASRLVPTLVKFASERLALWLAGKAHPGMPLEHVATPPAEISPRADTQYFKITKAEKYWETIVKEGRVGAYAPAALAGAEIDVLVWTPSESRS